MSNFIVRIYYNYTTKILRITLHLVIVARIQQLQFQITVIVIDIDISTTIS